MRNEAPLISVVTPVYNAARYLREAVDSVLAQTYAHFEMLLVDDGSTDASGEICDAYARADARIRVFHTPNGGLSHARNIGFDAARGEWIFFIDSDDAIAPQALETLLRGAAGCDTVICLMETFPENMFREAALREEKTYRSFRAMLEDYLSGAYFFNFNSACGRLYRNSRSPAMRFDESVRWAEDMIFNLEYLPQCGGVRVIPDKLYRYRCADAASLSRRFYFQEPNLRMREYRDYEAVLGAQNPAMRSVTANYTHYLCRYFFRLCRLPSKSEVEKATIVRYWLALGVAEHIADREEAVRPQLRSIWRGVRAGDAEMICQAASQTEE